MARKEHPRYESTEWPDYEFHEFPMMVYPGSKDGGKTPDRDPSRPGKFLQTPVTVNSEEERRLALDIDAPVEPEREPERTRTLVDAGNGTQRLQTPEDERNDLMERLDTAGVQFDRRWGLARLQDAWDEHQNKEVV